MSTAAADRTAYQAAYRAANREKIAVKNAAHYAANREKITAHNAAYRAANREKIAARDAARYAANREKIAVKKAAYYAANREQKAVYRAANREKITAHNAAYRAANREKITAHNAAYRAANREKIAAWRASPRVRAKMNAYARERLATDPQMKIAALLRNRFRTALKGKHRSGSAITLLGCTIPELMARFETLFTDGMTWDNHGYDTWHIDHIRPLASFDLKEPAQQAAAFHYTNLQPLSAFDNLSKGARR